MKKILFVFTILSFFIFACGEDNSSNKIAANKNVSTEKKAVDGSKVYKKNCVICHGTKGDMRASGAHDLTTSVLSLEERIAVITKGRNTMVGFENILSEEKIKAVAEFSRTLKK